MKKAIVFLLCAAGLLCAGCGTAQPAGGKLRAEDLPESCRAWFDIAETAGVAGEDSRFPAADSAEQGAAGGGVVARLPDGTEVKVADEDAAAGTKLSELTDGGAKRIDSAERLLWNGELYDTYTVAANNCTLPNLRPCEGGILRLDITGDCVVDGGGEEFGCFTGFDGVLITGSGTLTIRNAAGLNPGSGALPIPALMVDGIVTVRCTSVDAAANRSGVPAFVQLGGTVCAGSLWLDGGELVMADGILSVNHLSNAASGIFRGGVSLLGYADDCPALSVVLSGGALYMEGELPADAAVEAGAGILCAPGIGQLPVQGYKALIKDSETDGTPLAYTDYNEDWAGNLTWDALTVKKAEGKWFVGELTMENDRVDELRAQGALWLGLQGESLVQAELSGTSFLFTGGGRLTADTVKVWSLGGARAPLCSIAEETTVRCAEFHMGSETGKSGTVVVNHGTLAVDNAFRLENGVLEVRGGEVRIGGDAVIETGDLRISGGTVTLEKGLRISTGSVTLDGGVLVLPEGETSLVLEDGRINNRGGEIRTR